MFTVYFKQFCALATAFFMLIGGLMTPLKAEDTEELYREKVASVDIYENTIETAIPQTELFNVISEHFSSALPEGKTEKKAIVIGYDGCRADTLVNCAESGAVSTLISDGGSAYIGYCGGVNYPGMNTQATSTAPGWCSILTGQWADVHGITANGIVKSNDHLTLLTTLVESKTVDSSAFYVSWNGHFKRSDSTYKEEKKYCEDKGLAVRFKDASGDNGTLNNTLRDLSKKDCSDFIFSILEFTDHAGHNHGFFPERATYKYAFAKADSYAATLISKIKARETYDTEDWLIILTTDHGGFEKHHGSSSIQERMTFIISNKGIL